MSLDILLATAMLMAQIFALAYAYVLGLRDGDMGYFNQRNGNYKGSTSFTFEVERWRDANGTLLTDDEVSAITKGWSNDAFDNAFHYECIGLKVKGYVYFERGRYYGPPEMCYPDEGEEQISSVIGPNGEDWSKRLAEYERNKILERIVEDVKCGEDTD